MNDVEEKTPDHPSDQNHPAVTPTRNLPKLDNPVNPTSKNIRFGRLLVASICWTTLTFFLGCCLPMWAYTGEVWNGIGLGAFCASWGGPGFGTMVAGSIWSNRQTLNEDH